VNYRRLVLPFVVTAIAYAQGQNTEGTRQMYYLGPPEAPAGKALPSAKTSSMHLGLRYNVVLLGQNNTTEEISSSRVLKDGDRFAIELQVNRAGYLYVLAQQSSGAWLPLFPSTEIAGQSNYLDAFKKVRVPEGYYFRIHPPAGKETLFVVFSRDKKDFFELYESVKTKQENGGDATNAVHMADAKQMANAIDRLTEKFGESRDISITKIPEPVKKDEPRGAVYVVNTSSKLSSSLVTKIEITHQ
jgi:hypothetical protein